MTDRKEQRLQDETTLNDAALEDTALENTALEKTTLEEDFKALDQMVTALEQDDLPIDQAFALYEQGLHMLKQCTGKLDLIEKKMIQLQNQNESEL